MWYGVINIGIFSSKAQAISDFASSESAAHIPFSFRLPHQRHALPSLFSPLALRPS
jgi:hypothetical protein